MSRVEAAAAMDRLPWLADETAADSRPGAGGGGTVLAAFAAILLVGGGGVLDGRAQRRAKRRCLPAFAADGDHGAAPAGAPGRAGPQARRSSRRSGAPNPDRRAADAARSRQRRCATPRLPKPRKAPRRTSPSRSVIAKAEPRSRQLPNRRSPGRCG